MKRKQPKIKVLRRICFVVSDISDQKSTQQTKTKIQGQHAFKKNTLYTWSK